ncbi:MAG: hypothetical protein ACR2GQ_07305 [Gemmatimonadota bacterium]
MNILFGRGRFRGRGQFRRSAVLAGALILPATSCGGQEPPTAPVVGEAAVRVLFIGNSLTYFNEMPAMLATLLRETGTESALVASVSRPSYGLEDHWTQSATFDRIAEGWDVVVLQQGPSATEGRPSLLEYSRKFAAPIREAGAIPALYMVWPSETRFSDFAGVSSSYSDAADQIDGLLFPAGEAWIAAWKLDTSIELYGFDRFHPSLLGSYTAAVVIYEQLTGRDPRELPPTIPGYPDAATPEHVRLVQQAARQANIEHRRVATR